MKKLSILVALISFLLFTETLSAEHKNLNSLAQKIKRSADRSKDFVLSKDGQNLLLFVLSAGFLVYLPRHLSKYPMLTKSSKNIVDNIIEWPYATFFSKTPWATHLYYEIITLLAGYTCAKTGRPYLEKLKQS